APLSRASDAWLPASLCLKPSSSFGPSPRIRLLQPLLTSRSAGRTTEKPRTSVRGLWRELRSGLRRRLCGSGKLFRRRSRQAPPMGSQSCIKDGE
ncbi:hypothetical protein CN157_09070, partial [Sinorhizobium meliloti]